MMCNNDNGINTAIGCIPIFSNDAMVAFVSFLLRWSSGIAGGIGMILIIYSGYMIMTSAGDPKKVQAGKELLQASLSGIFMVVFAVFLLRIIAADTLSIF